MEDKRVAAAATGSRSDAQPSLAAARRRGRLRLNKGHRHALALVMPRAHLRQQRGCGRVEGDTNPTVEDPLLHVALKVDLAHDGQLCAVANLRGRLDHVHESKHASTVEP